MNGKSIMWDYVAEEQPVLRRMLESDELRAAAGGMPCLKALYFVAHGSSFNAACAVSDFLARHTGLRVYADIPGNFPGRCSTLCREERSGTLVAAISQTGTSRGTLKAASQAAALGFKVLGITADSRSPLAQLADYHLPLLCGPEDSNAKTKGYSSTLLLLLMLGAEYGARHQMIGSDCYQDIYRELSESIEELPAAVKETVKWCADTRYGKDISNIFVLGSGTNYGSALEGGLKLMETMCMPGLFNDIEEFSHGMHRAINRDSSVLLINTDPERNELFWQTFDYVSGKTESIAMINASGILIDHERVVNLKRHPLCESLLTITSVIQVLSILIPELNGLDPNRWANDDFTHFVGTRV